MLCFLLAYGSMVKAELVRETELLNSMQSVFTSCFLVRSLCFKFYLIVDLSEADGEDNHLSKFQK